MILLPLFYAINFFLILFFKLYFPRGLYFDCTLMSQVDHVELEIRGTSYVKSSDNLPWPFGVGWVVC